MATLYRMHFSTFSPHQTFCDVLKTSQVCSCLISYKLVQISPIMILVNSGAFLSISSWFCELTELIFVMIPYISSTGYPPTTQGIMGHVQVAN